MKTEEISTGAIKMNVGATYDMDVSAQRLIGMIGQSAIEMVIGDAEKFTEKRNGKTISLADVAKTLNMNEENAIDVMKMMKQIRNEG